MQSSKRILATALAAGAAALALAFGALGATAKSGHGNHGQSNRGKHGGAKLIDASLAPSQPTDPKFHNVSPGLAPWVLKRGTVFIQRRGRLELSVRGLVIPAFGTPNTVMTISASLYCGADSNAAPADTTQQVPISRKGNARIRDRSFAVPATCLAPVVLVHPNGDTTHYIAVDGWRLNG